MTTTTTINLPVKAYAAQVGRHVSTIYRWIKAAKVQAIKVGRWLHIVVVREVKVVKNGDTATRKINGVDWTFKTWKKPGASPRIYITQHFSAGDRDFGFFSSDGEYTPKRIHCGTRDLRNEAKEEFGGIRSSVMQELGF